MANLPDFSTMRRWMNGSAQLRRDQEVVEIGDRFQLRDRHSSVWVVNRISNVEASRFPLVSLRHESYPQLEKTVSMVALEDGIDFVAIPRP